MKTKLPLPAEALAFARDLRHDTTDAEQRLWYLLRDRRLGGFKFRRQHPCPPYVLDFYCDAQRLAIELDGSQHLDDTVRAATRCVSAWTRHSCTEILERCGVQGDGERA